MEGIKFFIGMVMPFVTLLVFAGGISYKLFRWTKAAQGRMTLFPASSRWSDKWKKIGKELLIFQNLFEGNKSLWFGTWIFHLSLALIIIGHARAVSSFADLPLKALGMGERDLNTMSALLGGGAGIVILLMGIYLLVRRFAVIRVREISDGEDYFTLLLILAIIISGDIMRFVTHFDLTQSRQYFAALFTFSPATVPSDPAFLVHAFLGQVLILYIPFSKFLHIPGVFYSKSIIYQE